MNKTTPNELLAELTQLEAEMAALSKRRAAIWKEIRKLMAEEIAKQPLEVQGEH